MSGRPTVMVSSWSDGVTMLQDGEVRRAFAGQSVCGLAGDGAGGAYALVDSATVYAWSPGDGWRARATHDAPLRCCVAHDGRLLVGTDDARVFALSGGTWTPLPGLEATPGRETWYAGTAVIDGQVLGPPLGVRSMAASCDGRAVFANVHVGGIPCSTDGAASWAPTIEVDADVHQVATHPSRPEIVIAAAAAGLCVSRDGGRSWSITTEGLHAPYGSAVAMTGDWLYLAASTDHFAAQGALYRRRIDGDGPLQRVRGGLPEWLDGIADSYCLAARGETLAVADHGGALYGSLDGGDSWSMWAERLPAPSGVLIC